MNKNVVSKEIKKIDNRKLGVAVVALMAGSAAMASTTTTTATAFDTFYSSVVEWLQGKLGLIIALLGMLGTLIIYAFTHKGSVLFMGILLSFLAGGLVGIVEVMFDVGQNAFERTTTP